MIFSEFIDVTLPTTLNFVFLPENVGVGSGLLYHPRIGINPGHF
jgi:hypothetical protein